ncbi:unnamed protein product, partial [Prorocentrum cordatum]
AIPACRAFYSAAWDIFGDGLEVTCDFQLVFPSLQAGADDAFVTVDSGAGRQRQRCCSRPSNIVRVALRPRCISPQRTNAKGLWKFRPKVSKGDNFELHCKAIIDPDLREKRGWVEAMVIVDMTEGGGYDRAWAWARFLRALVALPVDALHFLGVEMVEDAGDAVAEPPAWDESFGPTVKPLLIRACRGRSPRAISSKRIYVRRVLPDRRQRAAIVAPLEVTSAAQSTARQVVPPEKDLSGARQCKCLSAFPIQRANCPFVDDFVVEAGGDCADGAVELVRWCLETKRGEDLVNFPRGLRPHGRSRDY